MSDNGKASQPLRHKEYAAFIEGIELKDIRLISIRADAKGSGCKPFGCSIATTAKAWYESQGSDFTAFHSYSVTVRDPETRDPVAKLTTVFAASFSSKIAMDERIFSIFARRNLPVNTWPYLRELLHNIFARMNLPQIVAPTFKIGVSREQVSKGPKAS